MLDFLKKFFAEEPPEELTIDELRAKAAEKIMTGEEELKNYLTEKSKEIADKRRELLEALDALEKAELRNPNIPDKAKHFMQGNRATYVKMARMLERDLHVPESLDQIEESLANFQKEIDRFSLSTVRAYKILQEFFAHESEIVAQKIKDVDNEYDDLKTRLTDLKLDTYRHIMRKISTLDERHDLRRKKQEEHDKLRKLLEDARIAKDEADQKLREFYESEIYANHEKMHQELLKAQEAVRKHEKEFIDEFQLLEKPLKKLAYIAFEEEAIIKPYLSHPVQALVNDYELKIVRALQKLKKVIQSNEVEIEERRKEKTLSVIDALTVQKLAKYLSEYNAMAKKVRELTESIQDNGAKTNEDKLQETLTSASATIAHAEHDLKEALKDLDSITADTILTELEEAWNHLHPGRIRLRKPASE